MKRAILGLLAFAVSFAPLVGAGPAQADTTYGSTSGIDGVLYDDCRYYPYSYTVNVPVAGYRDLVVSLRGPDGLEADTDYVAPATNQATGTSTFLLCPPTNLYGSYTIRATVRWGDDAEHISETRPLDDSHFTLRKPFTRTSLSVSTRRPAYGQVVTYRILTMDERPTSYYPTAFAWVVLQKKVDGQWVRIKSSRTLTHSTGWVKLRMKYLHHHKRMKVRAVTQAADRYARSVSTPVRLW
jgi:hypothetical protein